MQLRRCGRFSRHCPPRPEDARRRIRQGSGVPQMKRFIGLMASLVLATGSTAAFAGGYDNDNDEAIVGAIVGGLLGFAIGSSVNDNHGYYGGGYGYSSAPYGGYGGGYGYSSAPYGGYGGG